MNKSVGRLVSVLYRKNQVYLDIALSAYNITASEVAFITALYRKDGINQELLSQTLNIDKAATAKAIKSLETKGYVYRTKNASDRRANMIFISEYARSQKRGIYKELGKWTDFLTRDIEADKVETMFEVLNRMVEHLEKGFLPVWDDDEI
ncbi:MAG: MarR family transcriptional regulator [Candidatus Cloacimonetes bacterium]|nr:MarR family transcriptional regulator [Candidatus Cloacimonadota bacterium]